MRQETSRIYRLLYWEAAFSMAYETWIGPIYMSGLAGELGVAVGLVTLMTGLMWIGYAGQVLGGWMASRATSAKRYCLAVATMARSLWVLPLLLALVWGLPTDKEFPKERWMHWVAFLACFSSICGSSGTVSWMSWMKSIIPEDFKGRFFGVRQRISMLGIVGANFLGALWVGYKPDGIYAGYFILGICAVIAGLSSSFLLAKVPDAETLTPVPFHWRELMRPLQDRRFRAALVVWPLFNCAVQCVGPYFPYFFTRDLSFQMSSVSWWSLLANVGAVLTASFWGARIDRTRDTLWVIWVTGWLMVASPLIYTFAPTSIVPFLAPPEHFINGIAWSGLQVGAVSLVLQVVPQARNALYFSVYFALVGIGGGLGVFLGGKLIELFGAFPQLQIQGSVFRSLWLVGAALRAIALIAGLTYAKRVLASTKATSGNLA